jgi:tetratricopeptide (TPR) repeat protein
MEDRIYRLIKEAEALREKSKYTDSLKVFKKASSISKRHDILDGILDSTIAMADIYRMIGKFDNAIKNYEEALEACEALGNKLTAADCMVGIGLSLKAMGIWRDAIRFISSARGIYEKEKDTRGKAFSLWAEASALRVAGDIPKAIKKFKKSKDIFTRVKDKSGIAYALCGLGGTHRISGKFKESLNYYKQASETFKMLKDKFGTAYSHCGIGNAFRMLGNYSDALKHFKKAIALYEDIGDMVSYSYTLWSLATVHKMEMDFDNARLYIKKALKNFKNTKDSRGIIYCNLSLGEIDFIEGNKHIAEDRFLSAMDIAAKHNFKLEKCHSEALLNYIKGQGLRVKGQTVKFISCYKKIGVNLDFSGIPFNMP